MQNKSIAQLFDFTGQVAVVTGGAKGIGYGIVKRFAEAGAKVVIADMDAEVGAAKAEAVRSEYGTECEFVKTDVSSEEDVKGLVGHAVDKFGRIDIFVNNAGIFPAQTTLETDLVFWEKIQAVNLRGVFLGCREVGKVMAEAKRGVVINVASIDALHPSHVGYAAYDASKHGVWGFTKNFALEMSAYGVRVNAIAPGGVSTEGVAALSGGSVPQEISNEFMKKIPFRRFAEPDEIATVALFLASDASRYMTGSIVVADGGTLLA
jgi:2-deoxy-D-gluconate 3-dehydrogenase